MSHIKTTCMFPSNCIGKRKPCCPDDTMVASTCICDLFFHMDECGEDLGDDWKPNRQRIEEIAVAYSGEREQ